MIKRDGKLLAYRIFVQSATQNKVAKWLCLLTYAMLIIKS